MCIRYDINQISKFQINKVIYFIISLYVTFTFLGYVYHHNLDEDQLLRNTHFFFGKWPIIFSNKNGNFESIVYKIMCKLNIKISNNRNHIILSYNIFLSHLFETTFKGPDCALKIAFEGICNIIIEIEAVFCEIQIGIFGEWPESANVLKMICSQWLSNF